MSLDIGKVAIALLGLLAYKNRDKIGELIAGRKSTDPNASAGSPCRAFTMHALMRSCERRWLRPMRL
ncbi:hypothetical protein NKH37_28135 [Mesorhizobium sp. M1217]|uniref:hypothetical protein n=1 Tax=Mesorhizobium sp. M1217 TaxID=2957070 RepID=UPI00333B37FC